MTEISRPDFTYQWSSGGAIVAPSNVKIQTGWTSEVPPFQWENWSQNRQDNAIVHMFQKGISVWSSTQDYYFTVSGTRSFVQGSDGFIYEAVQSSTNQDPTLDTTNTYWKQAFRSQSGAQLYALDTGTANTYKAAYVPVIKTVVDGMVLKFKALNANTGVSTFTPNNGIIAAASIVGGGHSALQGGEIVATGDIWLQWNSSIGGGSWVLVEASGGGVQVAAATKSSHALQLGQATGRLLRTSVYRNNAGTLQVSVNGTAFVTAASTFTPLSTTTFIIADALAGGGGGGGTNSTGAAQTANGSGGGAGGYAKGLFTTGFSGANVVVGAGGGAAAGSAGATGATSSLGALLVSTGGTGGTLGAAQSNTVTAAVGQGVGGLGSGGNIINAAGGIGSYALYGSTNISGSGGNSVFGGGAAFASGTSAGNAAVSPGGGGSGGAVGASVGVGATGGAGAGGLVTIQEYV